MNINERLSNRTLKERLIELYLKKMEQAGRWKGLWWSELDNVQQNRKP